MSLPVVSAQTGSAFMAFAVWPSDAVRVTGQTSQWTSSTDQRTFRPSCASTLLASSDGSNEFEIRTGSLDDAPSMLAPQCELRVPRREHWLPAVPGTDQFEGKRDSAKVEKAGETLSSPSWCKANARAAATAN